MKIKSFLFSFFRHVAINVGWVFYKAFLYKPNVYDKISTIQLIVDNQLSISRFGDGEFRLMTQQGKIGFQDYNPNLSKALVESFKTRNSKLLICSFDFREKRPMNNYAGRWLKSFIFYKYKKIIPLFDKKYFYGNAEISRFYNPAFFKTTDFEYLFSTYIPILKKIWDKRDVIIVEGEQTKLGVGNDLFDCCASLKRIICPSKNAFSKYDDILKSIIHNYMSGDLVLLALGPTASILSVDLCVNYGIQSVDIGHIDIVYNWCLNRCTEPCFIQGKEVNEAASGNATISIEFDKEKYSREIVDRIYE